ncbi:hypothetical protein LOTGIDRAFT_169500 [Lottia gigantea]|uniref:Multidrug and toxin extrusion protein n=1 Tax=Lottia gigantea TaxID=225164 RepID=V3ZGJ0_LOTGI|nr:hypothetical protein LOTGIDRAFT_169500 [Lottia gigantea]ESO83282.1 hypothetical protein LOTGIDRAFT_169500 [Lottia gigantea]
MEPRIGDKFLIDLWKETKAIFKLMVLTIPTQLLVALPCSLCIMFAGHVSVETLNAVGMGFTYIYCTAYSSSIGLGITCEVLFSQANGSTKRSSLGLVIQRCLVISFLLFLLNGAMATHSYILIKFLGKNDQTVEEYYYFMLAAIPGFWGFSVMLVEMKYLQCQKIVKPCVVIGIIVNISHVMFGIPLTLWTGLGSTGTGLSFSLTYWLWAILFFVYIKLSKVCVETWVPWSTECFNCWWPILKIAIPNTCMIALEFSLFQAFLVLCAMLGSFYLSIYLIAANVSEFIYNMFLGSCSAAIIHIGNYLGNGDYELAKLSAQASVFLVVCQSVVDFCTVLILCYVLPFLYSNDNLIIRESRPLIILFALLHLLQGVGFIYGGLLKACSKQQFVMMAHIACIGIIGFPIAYCLMFLVSLNVYGAAIAIQISEVFLCIFTFAKGHFLNWKEEAYLAVEQAHKTTTIDRNNYEDSVNDPNSVKESTRLVTKPLNKNWKTVLQKGFFIVLFTAVFIGSIYISILAFCTGERPVLLGGS